MLRKWIKRLAVLVAIAAVAIWLSNSSWLAGPGKARAYLVAHRGLAQDFVREGLTGETCTAARMVDTDHTYLENTLVSIEAAFGMGADVVEFDVHPTTDGRFAVFHDWTLDCRTEGSGVTRQQSLEYLQQLDIGYGYTADGGKTFPFRGKGVGMMPSLEEVLDAFPDRDFVIDMKGSEAASGELMARRLAVLQPGRSGKIWLTGGPRSVRPVVAVHPELGAVTRPQLKRCLSRYIALGWSGHVPAACRDSMLTIPANVAPWLWGWPHRFVRRMDAAGSQVVLLGDYGGEGFSTGFDDPSGVGELPEGVGVWTDRLEHVGPAWAGRGGTSP